MMCNGWNGFGHYGFSSLGFMGMGLGMILHLAIIALVIIGIIKLYKSLKYTHICNNQANTAAIQILNQRYAKGEINSEEYQNIKKDLQ